MVLRAPGDTFDQIGYATSTDGIAWTKHDGDDPDALPDPVVAVGLPGSQDAFSAAHPTVLFDGGLWKMWYEGDDSTKKSIAYATSTDGLTWSKAGAVIESGSGNVEFGVFAPTVWKDRRREPFKMLVGGRKETQQGSGVFQTKLIAANSPDGLDWTLGNIALNPASFASSNLSSPEVVPEGNAIKLYYSGNDANEGDARDRIGFATSTGGTAQTLALDIAPRSALLDAREAFDLAAAEPGARRRAGRRLRRAQGGRRAAPAAGEVGRRGTTLDQGPAGGRRPGHPEGTNNQFDEDGQRDPHLVYEQDSGANPATDYFLFFTGIEDGVETIGLATASEEAATKQPDRHVGRSRRQPVLRPRRLGGSSTRRASRTRRSSTSPSNWAMYYTGRNAGGATTIGRAVATSPAGAYGGRQAITLNPATAGTPAAACDANGRRDPEAVVIDGVVHLLFVGLQTVEGATVERTCWAKATSAGETATFDRMGPVLNPSQLPYAFDETGVAPSSIVDDGGTMLRVFTTGTGRDGRVRAGSASTRAAARGDRHRRHPQRLGDLPDGRRGHARARLPEDRRHRHGHRHRALDERAPAVLDGGHAVLVGSVPGRRRRRRRGAELPARRQRGRGGARRPLAGAPAPARPVVRRAAPRQGGDRPRRRLVLPAAAPRRRRTSGRRRSSRCRAGRA